MKNLKDVAEALSSAAAEQKMLAKDLAATSGVTPQTLVNIFKHHSDFRVSNLLALADRLGLELLLIPKAAVPGLRGPSMDQPQIKSKIDLALERVSGNANKKAGR